MRCRKVKRELVGFIHKALDEESRRAVSKHLWICPACAGEERRLHWVADILGRARAVAPPPSLLHSARSKVAGAQGEALARGQGLARRVWHLSPAALVVAMGLAVASGLLMAHSSTSGQKARELRQLQERIRAEGLLRQAHLLQREMPQLADQMVLAGVELVLREVANLDPRSPGEEEIQEIKKRVATSEAVESLTSLVRRAEGMKKNALGRLLLGIQEIEKL